MPVTPRLPQRLGEAGWSGVTPRPASVTSRLLVVPVAQKVSLARQGTPASPGPPPPSRVVTVGFLQIVAVGGR
jgi:hypothetical protein